MYFDTHAHLNMEPFIKDPEPWIDRARAAGVHQILVPGIDIKSSENAILLAERFEGVYAAAGIHPQDCLSAPKDYIRILESMLKHPKVLALGEVGLDYYRNYAPREDQLNVFREQIPLAASTNMPMIIHNREADIDIFTCLKELGYFNAQFHCYGSDADFAKKILAEGAVISFTGVISFSKKAREIAATIPLEKLMIETDSPFMAPVPHRGKTNEPAYVTEVARVYGEIFGKSREEIAALTRKSSEAFFRIGA